MHRLWSLKENIELVTLSSFCEEHQIQAIDFLKLDVEGYEIAVLKGAGEMLIAKKFGSYNLNLEVVV